MANNSTNTDSTNADSANAASANTGFIFLLFATSFICYAFTGTILFRSNRNPLIVILCLGGMLICFSSLSGLFYDHMSELQFAVQTGFKESPSLICFVRGIITEIGALTTALAGTCFTHHTYRLLVKPKKNDLGVGGYQNIYYKIIGFSLGALGLILVVLSAIFKAIQPQLFVCDIRSPIWIRLLGYSGVNMVLTFPAVYWSVLATIAVFRHLDRFKTNSSRTKGGSKQSTQTMINYQATSEQTGKNPEQNEEVNLEQIVVRSDDKNSDQPSLQPQMHVGESSTPSSNTVISQPLASVSEQAVTKAPKVATTVNKRYNVTRNAGFRMVIFTTLFFVLNVGATIQTILAAIRGIQVNATHVASNDLVASTMGVFVFLIFGTVPEAKKTLRLLFSCERL